MAKHTIGIGDGGIGGRAVVEQHMRDGSVRHESGEFELNAENIARIQLDRITRGKLFKREEERILIMTKSKKRVEIFRSKLDSDFGDACEKLKAFAKKRYVTLQDDLTETI